MNKTVLFLILIFWILDILGQEKISCKIKNYNNQPIPYATIKFMPGNMGTITNSNGFFEFSLKCQNELKYFQVSCIGYQTRIFSIDSLLTNQKINRPIKLLLKKQNYKLFEIIVKKQKILKDPNQIVSNAINSLPNLLDNKPHIGKYYYRQTHRLDSSINRLIEAAISIYDPGFMHNINQCKFNVDQIQSSFDNRMIDFKDLLDRYFFQKKKRKYYYDSRIKSNSSYKDTLVQRYLIEDLDHHYASFSKFFISTNMIRSKQNGKRKKSLRINPHFINGKPIITDSFVREHKFKLDTFIYYNNYPVYKIKILPNKRYPKIKYLEDSKIPIGYMYVRVKDYAILYLDYGYTNNPKYKHSRGKLRHYFQFKIKFDEFSDKLYLSYLYSDRFDYVSDLSRRRRIIQELSISKIITDQNTINNKLQNTTWDDDIYKKRPYDPEFWKNYSIMLPTQEEKLLKDDLIKSLSKKN